MKTDIEIELYNSVYNKGMFNVLNNDTIGNWYGYHYIDETVSHFNRYSKGKIHGLRYGFHPKLKELKNISKLKYGKYNGISVMKLYKEDGWESYMLEVVIRENDKLVKQMEPRVVLD